MFIACSQHATLRRVSNVQVKHIPDDVHEQLRARAAQQGTTISDYVLELIRRDLKRPSRKEWLAQVAALPPLGIDDDEVQRIRDELRLERDGEPW
jgi:plasmid stability protein